MKSCIDTDSTWLVLCSINKSSYEQELAHVQLDWEHLVADMNARKDEDSKFICSIEVENEQLKTALAAKDAEVLDLRSQIEALNREQEACNAQMIDMDTQISKFSISFVYKSLAILFILIPTISKNDSLEYWLYTIQLFVSLISLSFDLCFIM